MPDKVLISEVGLRDGLQSISCVMPLEAKIAWLRAEAAAGVTEMEVGSFVNYDRLPQMADTAALVAVGRDIPGLTASVLVPNLRGAEAAIKAGAHKLSVPVSVSETHSLRNVNRSHAQMLDELRAIRALIDAQPATDRPGFEVGLSTAFGCSLEGAVAEAAVVRLAADVIAAGVEEVGLSDTTGYADPAMVRARVRAVRAEVGDRLAAVHLHNTRGLGLANALAALDEGIRTIDASLAGLGGCPAAPGASGNIVTEDLAFMLAAMGFETGIDLEALAKVRTILQDALPVEPLYGFVPDAGLPKGFADRRF